MLFFAIVGRLINMYFNQHVEKFPAVIIGQLEL